MDAKDKSYILETREKLCLCKIYLFALSLWFKEWGALWSICFTNPFSFSPLC